MAALNSAPITDDAATTPTDDVVASASQLSLTVSEASEPQIPEYISVRCGSATGLLYLDKFRGSGNKGSLKCIFHLGTLQ